MNKKIVAVLFVKMNNYFRVGFGSKTMALSQKLCAQFLEIVDLTVEDNADRSIFIEDRLVTRF